MNNGEWIGLDPTSGPLERKDERRLRPRPDALDGQVIGLVAYNPFYTHPHKQLTLISNSRTRQLVSAAHQLSCSLHNQSPANNIPAANTNMMQAITPSITRHA